MNQDSNNLNFQKLYHEHFNSPMPDECKELEEIDGIDPLLLDYSISSVLVAVSPKSTLRDYEQHRLLKECVHDLEIILPHLSGVSLDYFSRLNQISQHVLKHAFMRAK